MEAETLVHAIDQLSIDENQFKDQISSNNENILQNIQNWDLFLKPECLNDVENRLDQLVKSELNSIIKFLKNYNIKDSDIPLSEEETKLHFDLANTQEILAALNSLWVIQSAFSEVRGLINIGELASALASAENVGRKVEVFAGRYSTVRLVPELEKESKSLTDGILKKLDDSWNDAIVFICNEDTVLLSIAQSVDNISLSNLYETVQIADAEKFHKSRRIEQFLDALEHNIFGPILGKQLTNATVTDGQLSLEYISDSSLITLTKLIFSLKTTVKFLNDQLEESLLSISIAKRFSHMLITELIRSVLPSYFPEDSTELKAYSGEISQAIEFEKCLNDIGWTKSSDIEQWTSNINAEWILHRKNHHLDYLRGVFKKDLKTIQLEIEENSSVSHSSNGNKQNTPIETKPVEEDWDWNDDEEQNTVSTADVETKEAQKGDNEWGEQEDWGAWDEDNTENQRNQPNQQTQQKGVETGSASTLTGTSVKEHIIVTLLPDSILDCISRFIFEIEDLGETPRTNHLADLITLYRIAAPKLYKNKAKSMIIMLNDMNQLYTKMSNGLLKDIIPGELVLLKDQTDLTLDQIMQMQYRQLYDIIDQADGFINCIESENGVVCQKSIDEVVKYIEQEFEELIKYSTTIQASQCTGQLVEKAITRIMDEIEDKQDISEEESVDLSRILGKIPELEKLFPSQDSSITSSIAVFVPSWIKFQYFIEILQSSLADIDYLLTENSLVDFTGTELEGLVSALFAPSENRSGLIGKIRESLRV